MRKIAIDTNTYIKFVSGDKYILDVLAKAEIVYVSVIVIGELLSGFKAGTKEHINKEHLEEFLNKSIVQRLDVTDETSEVFADIKYSLRKAGTPIPSNDVWIAAHAFETGSVLITYDKHFKRVPGLRIWDKI